MNDAILAMHNLQNFVLGMILMFVAFIAWRVR